MLIIVELNRYKNMLWNLFSQCSPILMLLLILHQNSEKVPVKEVF